MLAEKAKRIGWQGWKGIAHARPDKLPDSKVSELFDDADPLLLPIREYGSFHKPTATDWAIDRISEAHGWDVATTENNELSAHMVHDTSGCDFYQHLLHPTGFTGQLESGRNYVAVCDEIHTGGVIASLREFADSQVACLIGLILVRTELGQRGTLFELPARKDQIAKMESLPIGELIRERLGYDTECLTSLEARELLTDWNENRLNVNIELRHRCSGCDAELPDPADWHFIGTGYWRQELPSCIDCFNTFYEIREMSDSVSN